MTLIKVFAILRAISIIWLPYYKEGRTAGVLLVVGVVAVVLGVCTDTVLIGKRRCVDLADNPRVCPNCCGQTQKLVWIDSEPEYSGWLCENAYEDRCESSKWRKAMLEGIPVDEDEDGNPVVDKLGGERWFCARCGRHYCDS